MVLFTPLPPTHTQVQLLTRSRGYYKSKKIVQIQKEMI